ncbi:MAG: T9SS type A sorting domain-containing protein [Chlorobi bacterium]|nr:T9SS type A sorting domain-containing protein [Chlorobiota bacterium]
MKKLNFLILLIGVWFSVSAQSWQTLNTGNSSIPTNDIMSVYAENDSHIWLCTYGKGIVEYDGHTFTEHNSTTKEDLSFNQANCMLKDSAGNYWVTTEIDGLYKFKNGVWTHFSPADMGFQLGAYGSLHLRKMALQNGGPGFEGGALWIGSYSKGVIKYDGTTWKVFNSQTGPLPDPGIHALAVEESPNDTSCMVWVGTGSGLMKYDGQYWENFKIDNDSTPWVNAITFEDGGITFGNGILYVGTESGEFGIFYKGVWDIFNMADAYNPNNSIVDIKIDANNNKWIATDEEGLYFYDGKQMPGYNTENSDIPSNNVLSLDLSNSNDSIHVWLSANYTGLTRFAKTLITGIGNLPTPLKGLNLAIYPNPVHYAAKIQYQILSLQESSTATNISIYDLQGRKVITLLHENKKSGSYSLEFHPDAYHLVKGTYLLRLETGNHPVLKKIVIE